MLHFLKPRNISSLIEFDNAKKILILIFIGASSSGIVNDF